MTEAEAKRQIVSIKTELNSITRELREIAGDLRGQNFKGIGAEMCASAIDDVAGNYEDVIRKLDRINVSEAIERIKAEEIDCPGCMIFNS